jgi:hypothetical protein
MLVGRNPWNLRFRHLVSCLIEALRMLGRQQLSHQDHREQANEDPVLFAGKCCRT